MEALAAVRLEYPAAVLGAAVVSAASKAAAEVLEAVEHRGAGKIHFYMDERKNLRKIFMYYSGIHAGKKCA